MIGGEHQQLFLTSITSTESGCEEAIKSIQRYCDHWSVRQDCDNDSISGTIRQCAVCDIMMENEPTVPSCDTELRRNGKIEQYYKVLQMGSKLPLTTSAVCMNWFYFKTLFNIPTQEAVRRLDPTSVSLHLMLGCCASLINSAGSPVDLCQLAINAVIDLRQQFPVTNPLRDQRSEGVSSPSGDRDDSGAVKGCEEQEESADERRRRKQENKACDERVRINVKRIRDFTSGVINCCEGVVDSTNGGMEEGCCVYSNDGEITEAIMRQSLPHDSRFLVSNQWIKACVSDSLVNYSDSKGYGKYQPGVISLHENADRSEEHSVDLISEMVSDLDRSNANGILHQRGLDHDLDSTGANITSMFALTSQRAHMERNQCSDLIEQEVAIRIKKDSAVCYQQGLFLHQLHNITATISRESSSHMSRMNVLFHECLWCSLSMIPSLRSVIYDLITMTRFKMYSLTLGLRLAPSSIHVGSMLQTLINKKRRKKAVKRLGVEINCGGVLGGRKVSDQDHAVGMGTYVGNMHWGLMRGNGGDASGGDKSMRGRGARTLNNNTNDNKNGCDPRLRYGYGLTGKTVTPSALAETYNEWVNEKYPFMRQLIDQFNGDGSVSDLNLSLWLHLSGNGNPLCNINIRRMTTESDMHLQKTHGCFLPLLIHMYMTCNRIKSKVPKSTYQKLEKLAWKHLIPLQFKSDPIVNSIV